MPEAAGGRHQPGGLQGAPAPLLLVSLWLGQVQQPTPGQGQGPQAASADACWLGRAVARRTSALELKPGLLAGLVATWPQTALASAPRSPAGRWHGLQNGHACPWVQLPAAHGHPSQSHAWMALLQCSHYVPAHPLCQMQRWCRQAWLPFLPPCLPQQGACVVRGAQAARRVAVRAAGVLPPGQRGTWSTAGSTSQRPART